LLPALLSACAAEKEVAKLACRETDHTWIDWDESTRPTWLTKHYIDPSAVQSLSNCARCPAIRMKMGDMFLLRPIDGGPTVVMGTGGRTIEEERDRQAAKSAEIRSAFDALMSTRTREAVELSLRLHEAELARHLIDRDVKDPAEHAARRAPIDAEIAKVQHIIGLREKALVVMRMKFDLADQTISGAEHQRIAARMTELLGELARGNRGDVDLTDLGVPPDLLRRYLGELD
jgi:hypothetical protein